MVAMTIGRRLRKSTSIKPLQSLSTAHGSIKTVPIVSIVMRFKTYHLSQHGGLVIEAVGNISLLELQVEDVLPHFCAAGVLLFKGFRSEIEDFIAFSDRFGSGFLDYKGGVFKSGTLNRKPIGNVKTLLPATGGGQSFPIPLHGEMYYLQNRPSTIWLFCQVPPVTKGETTFCDGSALYSRLSAETKEFFQENRVKYIRRFTSSQWREVFQTDHLDEVRDSCLASDVSLSYNRSDDSMVTEYVCSAICEAGGKKVFVNSVLPAYLSEKFSGYFSAAGTEKQGVSLIIRAADGSKIPEHLLEEVRWVAEEITVPVSWQKHELLLINNHTHMHGRRETDGGERQICVRLGNRMIDK
jgi:alpha-ketoglutarate-dependent taurine dioxygenase